MANLKGILRRARKSQPSQLPKFMEKPGLLVDREFTMRMMNNPVDLGLESWVQDLARELRNLGL